MDLLMRRMTLMEDNSIDYIERPDYMRVDFTTTDESTTVSVGYVANSFTDYVIIDEEIKHSSLTPYNGSGFTFNVGPGNHTLYYRIVKPIADNYGGSINLTLKPSYLRLPITSLEAISLKNNLNKLWNIRYVGSRISLDYGRVDILDERVVPYITQNQASSVSGFIYIPKGSKKNISSSISALNLEKIIEWDFKYIV